MLKYSGNLWSRWYKGDSKLLVCILFLAVGRKGGRAGKNVVSVARAEVRLRKGWWRLQGKKDRGMNDYGGLLRSSD